MTVGTNAKTRVEIDSTALKLNIAALKSRLQSGVIFCAVVKANAYGHDLKTIVRLAHLEGINHFGVDSLEEAQIIRQRAPDAQIFILGYTPPERLKEVISAKCIQTIYDTLTLDTLANEAAKAQMKAMVNVKVETGTYRQGIPLKNLENLLRDVKRRERSIDLVGLSSHFADAENVKDPSLNLEQNRLFTQAVEITYKLNLEPKYLHLACSAAALDHPETQWNMVRFGLALYGLWPSVDLKDKNRVSRNAINLKPVLNWKTRVAQVKDVPSGTFVGYSRGYKTDRPIRLAVLPVGYYDGYRRALSGKTKVLIHGQLCPVIGTICMNMCMVDVSTLPKIKTGDIVTLLGRDGMHEISADDLAALLNTINYEIVTQINPLLPRVVI